jgi:hypothetical protein
MDILEKFDASFDDFEASGLDDFFDVAAGQVEIIDRFWFDHRIYHSTIVAFANRVMALMFWTGIDAKLMLDCSDPYEYASNKLLFKTLNAVKEQVPTFEFAAGVDSKTGDLIIRFSFEKAITAAQIAMSIM